MATTTTAGFQVVKPTAMPAVAGAHVRRRISPDAGRALEILGHAIEYLTDEYVHRMGSFSAQDAELEAVQLLIALNRQIYFECPVAPTLAERLGVRLRKMLHLRAA
jgi:hypothetical protein